MADTPGAPAPQAYFDTPELAERLQLVAHVVRNTDIIPYVRGPEGAGKSRFADRLAAIFRQETSLVVLSGDAVVDLPAAVCQAVGASAERWPTAAIDAASDNGLLVMVDDVDRMGVAAHQQLQALRAAGAKLIFLGSEDPAKLPVNWQVQLIDLLPFSEGQVKDFLAFIGDDRAQSLKAPGLARLHRECRGLPGLVIATQTAAKPDAERPLEILRHKLLRGIALLAAAMVVGLVLWQQERINALFEPPPEEMALPDSEIIPVQPLSPEAPETRPGETPATQIATAEPEVSVAPPQTADVPSPVAVPEGNEEAAMLPVVPEAVAPAEVAAEHGESQPAETAAETETSPRQQVPEVDASLVTESPESRPPLAAARGDQESGQQAPETAANESVAVPASKSEQASTSGQEPLPSAAGEAPPAVVTTGPRGLDWLRSRRADAMTLQLVGARDRAAIDDFIARHRLTGDYVVYERDLGGQPWFTLVFGEYPDRAAALRARAAMPKALHKAWPRTFESIWQQLPPAG